MVAKAGAKPIKSQELSAGLPHGTGAQGLEPSSGRPQAGNWIKVEQPGWKLVPRQDANARGEGLIYYSITPVPAIAVFKFLNFFI